MTTLLPRVAAALLIASLLAGCGTKPAEGPAATEMSTGERLTELKELLSLAQIDLGRAPTRVQELERYQRGSPFAYQSVAKGDLVVLWGANLGQGTSVVAYEKDAPTAGGWVLLQDRTVVQMSAAEFQAAPKAKK
jgi:hypothetical protein